MPLPSHGPPAYHPPSTTGIRQAAEAISRRRYETAAKAANLPPSIRFRDRPGATAIGLRSVGGVVRHAVRPHPWRCLSSRCSAGLAYTTEERAHSPPSCPASRGQAGERPWTARIAPRGGKPVRHVPPGPPATRVRPGGTRRDVRGGRRFASAVPPDVADTASVSADDRPSCRGLAQARHRGRRRRGDGVRTRRPRSAQWWEYAIEEPTLGAVHGALGGDQARAGRRPRHGRAGAVERFPASRSRSRCPTARRRRPVATRICCDASPRMAAAASG